MVCQNFSLIPQAACLAHPEASRLSDRALNNAAAHVVIIDLSEVREVTTSAFARLVLLRRALRRRGRDLRLTGLHGKPFDVYELNRLQRILPCC